MTARLAYRLAPQAAADLDAILSYSGRRFGPAQRARYATLIRLAIHRIAAEPDRIGSADRAEIEHGLRSYPIRLVARRRLAAAHILFYRQVSGQIVIIRILHDAMDPMQHLGVPDV